MPKQHLEADLQLTRVRWAEQNRGEGKSWQTLGMPGTQPQDPLDSQSQAGVPMVPKTHLLTSKELLMGSFGHSLPTPRPPTPTPPLQD